MSEPIIDKAVRLLRQGGLVALPTETVYGLAACADDELAVRRIFAAKGRPSTHPLIVHIGDASALSHWGRELPPVAHRLAEAFWPGPLSLVVKKQPHVSPVITGGQDTVAVRVPRHPLTQAILQRLGTGVAAPSANRFGRVSPTTAEHVRADLGDDVDLIVDGGPTDVGLESTIVDVSGEAPAVLRVGGLPLEALAEELGEIPPVREHSDVRVSGSLASHYAPRAGVVLASADDAAEHVALWRERGQKVAVLAPASLPPVSDSLRLLLPDDDAGMARELYGKLREADALGAEVIIAVLPQAVGLGVAVRDRLRRAAAPRFR